MWPFRKNYLKQADKICRNIRRAGDLNLTFVITENSGYADNLLEFSGALLNVSDGAIYELSKKISQRGDYFDSEASFDNFKNPELYTKKERSILKLAVHFVKIGKENLETIKTNALSKAICALAPERIPAPINSTQGLFRDFKRA
jgi:hypothetical protein